MITDFEHEGIGAGLEFDIAAAGRRAVAEALLAGQLNVLTGPPPVNAAASIAAKSNATIKSTKKEN